MPEINLDPKISLGLTPVNPIANLGQVLQTAGAIQDFQKAKELLPYAIEAGKAQSSSAKTAAEKALIELKKAQELYQPEIEAGKAQSRTAQATAGSAELKLGGEKAQVARNIAGAYATHPIVVEGKDPVAMMGLVAQMQQEMINSGLTPTEALTAVAPLSLAVHTNPKMLETALQTAVKQAAGPATQAVLQTPTLTSAAGAPATFTAGTGQIAPAAISGAEQSYPAPQNAPQAAPAGQPAKPASGTLSIGGLQLPYPIRKAGDIRPFAPSEAVDTEVQQKHRVSLLNRQRDLASAERVSDEVIKTAEKLEKESYFSKGGIAGNFERKLRLWVSSETYDQLAKDLANQALANANALGTSTTVGGLDMSKAATGSIQIPPEVLIEIARRNKADQTNIDLQAKAKQQFSQQFGDNNGATFDQIWRNNSDSRLFEAMSIDRSKMSAKEKTAAFAKLFKDMSPEEKADFKRKKANIDAMTNGNFAGVN